MERTLVLPGTNKRVRIAVAGEVVEQTTWNRSGAAKTTRHTCDNGYLAHRRAERAVAEKLRKGYVHLGEAVRSGALIFEARGGDALDLSLDGAWLAIASRAADDTAIAIELVEVATGIRRGVCEHRTGRVRITAVRFDGGDRRAIHLAYDAGGPRIAHADLETGELRDVARGELLGCDARRRRLLVGDAAVLRVFEGGASIYEHDRPAWTGAAIVAALSPSGRLLAFHFGDRHDIFRAGDHTRNEIQLWDIDARAQWESVALPLLSRLRAVGVAPGDTELVVAWSEGKGPVGLAIPEGHERWCVDAVTRGWVHAPDGSLLASLDRAHVRVFDAERREVMALARDLSHSAAFSGDGSRLALGTGMLASVYATRAG